MRVCGDCRVTLPDGARFCGHCGGLAVTVVSAPGSPPPAAPPARPPAGPRAASGSRPRPGRWVARVVGLAAVVAGGAWLVDQAVGVTRSAQQAAAAATAPCALVSQREASAIFGAPATSGQPFGTTSCSWIVARKPGKPAPAPGAVSYVLGVASYDIRPYTSHKPPIDPFALIPRDEVRSRTTLHGIGEKAVVATMAHSNLVVEFVEHGRAILLDYSVSYDTPRDPKPTERRREIIALARDVSKRL